VDIFNKNFKTVEDGLNLLRKAINVRNNMSGAVYWEVVDDECSIIITKLQSLGASDEQIQMAVNGR
jgi:hypothetical protein